MKKIMTGSERRKLILTLMRESEVPLSGGALGSAAGVSRQVVVQDIALLRTEGHEIVSTARGYVLDEPKLISRVFEDHHTDEQTEDELTAIVDCGGAIVDVMIEHGIYGKLTAPLSIRNRRDIQVYLKRMKESESELIMNMTSKRHFHTVSAESEEILDEIEDALREKGILVRVAEVENND